MTSKTKFVATKEDRARLEETLRSDDWRRRSSRSIGSHLGLPGNFVRRVRSELGLVPQQIEVPAKGGGWRIVQTKHIGTRCGSRTILPKHARMIEAAMPLARRIARKEANLKLDEDQLMSAIGEALMISAVMFDPERPNADWGRYAYSVICRAVRRSFAIHKRNIQRKKMFGADKGGELGDYSGEFLDAIAAHAVDIKNLSAKPKRESLTDRLSSLRGRDRVIAELMAGIDGDGQRDAAYIAKFFQVPMKTAEMMLDSAREAMVA